MDSAFPTLIRGSRQLSSEEDMIPDAAHTVLRKAMALIDEVPTDLGRALKQVADQGVVP